jgi:hypothetical protein
MYKKNREQNYLSICFSVFSIAATVNSPFSIGRTGTYVSRYAIWSLGISKYYGMAIALYYYIRTPQRSVAVKKAESVVVARRYKSR